MLWEYMDLTVLPFFETWSAHIFGGWQRVCWCTNEAFNQASPTKEFWENCPQKKGGHIYGKNEGWAYLRKLLYVYFFSFFYFISLVGVEQPAEAEVEGEDGGAAQPAGAQDLRQPGGLVLSGAVKMLMVMVMVVIMTAW